MSERLILETLLKFHLDGKGGEEAVAKVREIKAAAAALTDEFKKAGKGITDTTTHVGALDAATKKSAKSVGGLDEAFGKLGKTVAGYFAAGAVINFLRDSFTGFARVERQALVVENQIRSLGQAADGSGFRGFIKDLSDTAGILDDDLVPAFQRALTTFRDVATAQETVTIAAKFAAAGIGDVGSNVEALTSFFQTGMARGLKPFVQDIKAGADGTINLSEGLAQVYKSLETLGKPLEDAQSRVRALANVWDTLRDSAGASLDWIAQKVEIATTHWGKFVENVAGGFNLAEGQEQDRLNQQLVERDAAKRAADEKTALQKEAEKRDSDRKADERKKEHDKAVEAEKKLAEQRAAIDAKSTEDILAARIALETEGSKERLALELELIELKKAAAIQAAREVGADTVAIERLFALLRANRVALGVKGKGPEVDEFAGNSAKDLERIEEFLEEQHEIEVEATRARLELQRDMTLEGTKERLRAETELELAALDESIGDILAKLSDGDERKLQLTKAYAAQRANIIQKEIQAEIDMDRAKQRAAVAGNIATAADISTAVLGVFSDNKAAQYASAIINTAAAIAAANAIPPPANVPAIARAAAIGAAQIATIARTNIGSGGGSGANGGGFAPATAPKASIAPVSPSQAAAVAGRAPVKGGDVHVHIANAFGDELSMRRLARQVAKAGSNDPTRLK